MVRLAVTNEGPGIPKDKQKSLFLKFSQLEPSLSRSQEGMGLGLYICKQNIETLGGEIGVISEDGKGVTFFFTVPLIYTPPLSPLAALTAKIPGADKLTAAQNLLKVNNQATAVTAKAEIVKEPTVKKTKTKK